MKKIFLAGLMLSMSTAAFAGPFDLPSDSGIYIKFNNRELVDLGGLITGDDPTNSLVIPAGYSGTDTQGNWGVALITSVYTGAPAPEHGDVAQTSPILFADTVFPFANTGQITAIFGGIQLQTLHNAEGGWLDLWWHDSTGFLDPNNVEIFGSGPNATTVNAFSTDNGGIFLARINFVPGVLGGDAVPDCNTSIFTQSVLGGTGVGVANSYADVDTSGAHDGAWTSALNGNWFSNPCGGFSDIRFRNSYELLSAGLWSQVGGNVIGLISDDPARAFTVPEPFTLGLLGMGLAGLGVRMRRRTNVN